MSGGTVTVILRNALFSPYGRLGSVDVRFTVLTLREALPRLPRLSFLCKLLESHFGQRRRHNRRGYRHKYHHSMGTLRENSNPRPICATWATTVPTSPRGSSQLPLAERRKPTWVDFSVRSGAAQVPSKCQFSAKRSSDFSSAR